jgi:membrane associated rhomboid family serine protease
MKNIKEKLLLIYFPLVTATILITITYSLLNWIFVIQLEWLKINNMAIDFVGPIVFSFIIVCFILSPTIKLIRLKNNSSDYFGLYIFLSFILAIPTIIAQNYLSTATGKLTRLEHINKFTTVPKTKYYTLDNYYFSTEEASFSRHSEVTGKYGNKLNFYLYCVQPILKTSKHIIEDSCRYFLCERYSHEISNSLSDQEKVREFNVFLDNSYKEFDAHDFKNFTYLELLGVTNDSKYYKNAVKNNVLICDSEPLLFISHKGNYDDRNGGAFGWIFKSFGILIGILLLIILFLGYRPRSKRVNKNKPKSWQEKFKKDYFFLIPTKEFYIIPILISLNLIIYILMVFFGLGFISFDADDLFKLGGVEKNAVLNGEWWRLFTAMFIHGGLMHIISNLFTLFFIGIFAESILGVKRFTIVYILSGLGCSLASIFWHDNTVSVGASGAIFGLFGAVIALNLMKSISKKIDLTFLIMSSVFIGYNLIMGLFTNSDNAGHLGGLFTGFIIGIVISSVVKKEQVDKYNNK